MYNYKMMKDYYNYINNNYNNPTYAPKEENTLFNPYQGFIRGNLFPSLYDPYKIARPFEVEPMNDQAELLTYIDSLTFAAHELNLYLDVYPNDQQMIQKFNQYRMEANRAIEQYENSYGPLLVTSDATNVTPWAWDNRPWPWEN